MTTLIRTACLESDWMKGFCLRIWHATLAIACCLNPGSTVQILGDDTVTLSSQTSHQSEDWLFIDNGVVRLGVIKSSGAGIAWFSESGSTNNRVNHWDRGRLVQQSYYGKEDNSLWNKQPWRWNPVQGGDWRGHPAQVLELKSGTNWLHAKTLPKHWASGADLTNTVMEEWITLTGKVAHVHYQFTYTGTESHPKAHQEIPAFFVDPALDTLALYNGDKPWTGGTLHRSKPGWPNESRTLTEPWAAYVGPDDHGIGACVPVARELTCYRFGDGDPKHGACSYFAPLTMFAITPGFKFEYDLYLALGTTETIRETFRNICTAPSKTDSSNKP